MSTFTLLLRWFCCSRAGLARADCYTPTDGIGTDYSPRIPGSRILSGPLKASLGPLPDQAAALARLPRRFLTSLNRLAHWNPGNRKENFI